MVKCPKLRKKYHANMSSLVTFEITDFININLIFFILYISNVSIAQSQTPFILLILLCN